MRYPRFIGSVADPNKLALTIRGILVGLVPVIVLVSKASGWEIGEAGLMEAVDAVVTLVSATTALVAACMTVWGLLRKAYYAVFK